MCLITAGFKISPFSCLHILKSELKLFLEKDNEYFRGFYTRRRSWTNTIRDKKVVLFCGKECWTNCACSSMKTVIALFLTCMFPKNSVQ